MAYFAELNSDNTVLRTVLIDNNVIDNAEGLEKEAQGVAFCQSLFGSETIWKQTSRNTREGIHYDSQTNQPDDGFAFRGNYATPGMIYDATHDAFIVAKPTSTAVLNTTTYVWEEPTK